MRIDGELLHGDAELHFFESDWDAHGHGKDPAFDNVILHILVFPPKPRKSPTRWAIEHSLLFIDLLRQGLESYAEEEVLGALADGETTALEESLLILPLEKRYEKLLKAARSRWLGKVEYARKRLEILSWEEACHQTAMEILGYRYNRAVMLFLAGDYSLAAIRSGSHNVEDVYGAGKGKWKLSGSRPANHPNIRLGQYFEWVHARPNWPENLVSWGNEFQRAENLAPATYSRKSLQLGSRKRNLAKHVLANTVGGTRIENLVCDGFLPFLAARSGDDYFMPWYHWFPGDVPSALKQLFRRLGEESSAMGPHSNGAYQGLVGCLLEK
ncbi:MAG: DUF2851 family protein [Opitutales bacterium]|nr:DUF2851 family protein [Opitutales bacterium]